MTGVVMWSLTSGHVFAATIDELRYNIDQKNQIIKGLEEEITQYQIQIDEKEQEAATLKNQIVAVTANILKLDTDVRRTKHRIDKTQLEIEKLLLEIEITKSRIDSNKKNLAELLRAIYEEESRSLVEILLEHEQLSDFFDNLKYIEDLEENISSHVASLHNMKKDLEGQKATYEDEKSTLKLLQEELVDKKDIQENTKQQKQIILTTTKNKEAAYQALLAEREREREIIFQEIAEIEDELRTLIDPLSLPVARTGILSWPVKDPIVTQGFGMTTFAQRNSDVYQGKGHNGIDFRAPVGTPVYAAENGIVLKIGDTDVSCRGGSYGKWIVIEHPNNLATLYAHLSLIKVHDEADVQRDSLIGYSGRSGYVTGPHLHFTVYAAGKAGEIRFGPSSSERCALLPYGGYLNPLDYL